MDSKNSSKHSDFSMSKIIQTGIAGGVLFFGFSWLAYTFRFSTLSPVSVASFSQSSAVIEHMIAIICITIISIVLSLLYYALLRKRKPLLTGFVITVILFSLFLSFISKSTLNLITIFCLLLGYCVFISVSIAWIHEQSR